MANDLPIHLRKVTLFSALPISTSPGLYHSSQQDVEDTISYAVQVSWSNGAILDGQIYLEASNDGSNWVQIQQSLLSIANASGSHMINVEKPAYSFFRLSVSVFAGTATIDALFNAKRQ